MDQTALQFTLVITPHFRPNYNLAISQEDNISRETFRYKLHEFGVF
jgi:predicted transcriptional regulator